MYILNSRTKKSWTFFEGEEQVALGWTSGNFCRGGELLFWIEQASTDIRTLYSLSMKTFIYKY